MERPKRTELTADAFLAWAEDQPGGRYELSDGHVVAMAPERVAHARTKLRAVNALGAAIAARLGCEALTDSVAVRIDDRTVDEPDALVRCGPPAPGDAIEVRDPIIVVEVVSPLSRNLDTGLKLSGCFKLPSLRHYLVIDLDARVVIHHRRDAAAAGAVRLLREGSLSLTRPALRSPSKTSSPVLEPAGRPPPAASGPGGTTRDASFARPNGGAAHPRRCYNLAMSDLFDSLPAPRGPEPRPQPEGPRPLADRLRPARLTEVVGQDHVLGPDAPLGRALASRSLGSVILWGPPGVGKTTVARLLAAETSAAFVQISAIFTGVADLKKIFEAARLRHANGRATLLFVDEIHRFNRAQQDAFLPLMEEGVILLVGATTENPSFELNAALLSRAQVLTLRRLDAAALEKLAARAEAELGRPLPLTPEARETLIALADGDGRALLNLVEQIASEPGPLDAAALAQRLTRRAPLFDKSGDAHYDLISALHKSVRASDPDAALYWLARMLEGGEDPRYLARRITRMAVEDVGQADPQATPLCLAAWETYERLGSPEGELALAQAVIHLALAPKSNAGYRAFTAARAAARRTGSLPPPKHVLNAPTALMKAEGYGAGYVYDHDVEGGFSGQSHFPDGMERESFYEPTDRGAEAGAGDRLRFLAEARAALGRR